MSDISHSRRHMMVAALVLGALGADVADAQPVSPRGRLAEARRSLERGAYGDAESVYATTLASLAGSTDSATIAAAYFGRGFAAQQRLTATGAPPRTAVWDSVIADYAAAGRTDATLGAAAANNVAVILRANGLHEEAARYFRIAARFSGQSRGFTKADRATAFWNAGREDEALERPDSAVSAYRSAIDVDPTQLEPRQALIELFVRAFAAESTLVTARRWLADSVNAKASAKVASDGLLALLTRSIPPLSNEQAASALVLLCQSWPAMDMGPAYYVTVVQSQLRAIAAARPNLARGVESLEHAYTPRPRRDPYREPPSAEWWRVGGRGRDTRVAVWSSVLRSIGDWYNQHGEPAIARPYYEAAIGLPRNELREPYVDRRAMLPLALIYARQADTASSVQLQKELASFTAALFNAKNDAYRAGDVVQIREFHMTLGALYAARDQWEGPGAQNAQFQIEHMREASRTIENRLGIRTVDPPELLEKLAIHYMRTGQTAKVPAVKAAVRDVYQRAGRPDQADSAVRRIDATTVNRVQRP